MTAQLNLFAEHGQLHYTLLPVAPYEKRYPPEPVTYTDYLDHARKALFLGSTAKFTRAERGESATYVILSAPKSEFCGTAFLAYADGHLAGELRLSQHWNNFAHLENIVVEAAFRRQGVGRALIKRAQQWAMEKQLAGVMLETQDINVGACQLYEHCGFELGGFDRYLYHGLALGGQEVALYWYWRPPTAGVV